MPTPLWEFWTDWAVKAAGTLATFLAVFVALFGSWLRHWLTPAKLTLALVSDAGFYYLSIRPDRSGQTTDGFWYHVSVQNKRRWNTVSDVYIYLLSIEEEDAAGALTPVWIGSAALTWRHESPSKPKTIGPPVECDLCHILKEPLALYLSPIYPASVTPALFNKRCRIALTLQAKGTEVDSDRSRFEISWNDEWSDNPSKRKHNLKIKQVA